MKQSKLFHLLFPLVALSIPWIYIALIWNQLPQTIATHFDISGAPDKFGARNEIIYGPIITTVVGIFMYFLLLNIHKIDPKKKYTATTAGVLSKIAVITLLLLCGVSMMMCYSALRGRIEGLPLLFCGISLFFAYMGNLMHSIKPNYFAGFRVPWALENEENWRKTHQLASKIWFAGGVALAIVSLLLNVKILVFVFMGGVLIMTIIPALYSYNLYRQSLRSGNNK